MRKTAHPMSYVANTIVAIAFVAPVSLIIAPATAGTWECGERSNLPQEGKNYCAAGDFRQSEINLQKVLDTLLAKHKAAYGGDNKALSKSQAAFNDYRDNQCIAENKRISDKPFHPMIVAQCKTRLTNLRLNELKRMLDKIL